MSPRRAWCARVLVALLLVALPSCLVRRRIIARKGSNPSQTLLNANRDSLIGAIAHQYNAIHDFSATVDMVPALGTAEKSSITEYKDVRAYILYRQPAEIRIIGLYPVMRNKAFDMVSTGGSFKLYLPSQNAFLTGSGDAVPPSPNRLENLRPRHFLEALLTAPVDLSREKVILENLTDEDVAYYILLVIHEHDGQLQLDRTIWFNRANLQLTRQLIFDAEGNILTDARYSDWKLYDKVPFPKHIEINRPQDEYAVVIDVVKMDIDKGVSDDKFILERPEGTTMRTVGQKP